MRKILSLMLLSALLASLTACSSGKPRKSMPAPASAQSASRPATPVAPATVSPPAGDMNFKNYGVGSAVSAARQPVSTFGVDVDTASYTLARSYLERGTLPPAEAVRVEEFINFFPQFYAAPSSDPIAVHIAGGPNPFRPSYQLIQVGLKAREVAKGVRGPAVLTFVIDVSGSMAMENRLELVKRSLNLLLDQLRPEDLVGVVVYGTRGRILLGHTSDKGRIRSAIAELVPEGSTNAEEGLTLGYAEAYRNFREGAVNRVILATDGVANVGQTGPEAMLRRVEDFKARGITLTTVGFGMGNYNDVLLEQLADKGDGNYAYVDSLEEANRVFVEQLTGTLQVVAKDVKVQVQFDPAEVASYRLVGYENRTLKNEEFRDNQADAGEMGAGHAVTALYEIRLNTESRRGLGSVSVRYKDPATARVSEIVAAIPRSALAPTTAASPAGLRWSAAVAEFAGVLKGSPWAVETTLPGIAAVARRAAGDLDSPPAHREFLDMVELAMKAQGRR